ISCAYPIDVHGFENVSLGLKYDESVMPDERYWQVPYRCMIPKKTDNLLVAGRCAGFDFIAQSAARIQLVCRAMGEAAGLACALASKNKLDLSAVDPVSVHRELVSRGMQF
ncbi:MAG: FAD-dependent oxidoreductase, partial [Clostridia bacterium]|nr:FAD-dependent oxidoreductase [Clostridia bacterium]